MTLRIVPGHPGAAGLSMCIVAGVLVNIADGTALGGAGTPATRANPTDGATEWVFGSGGSAFSLLSTGGQPVESANPRYTYISEWTQDTTYPSNNCLMSAYALNYGNTLWLMVGFSAGDQYNFRQRGLRYVGGDASPKPYHSGTATQLRRHGVRQDDTTQVQRYNGVNYGAIPFNSSSSAFSDDSRVLIGARYDDASWTGANLFLRTLLVWNGATQPSQSVFEALVDNPRDIVETVPAGAASFSLTMDDAVFAGTAGPAPATPSANFALLMDDAVWSGSAGPRPGVLTTEPLKNFSGGILANDTGLIATVWNPATGALVLRKTGLSSDSSGVVVIADPALAVGTTYVYDIQRTNGHRRVPAGVAA